MDHLQDPLYAAQPDEQPVATPPAFVYPPKYQKAEQQPINVWSKSIASLALYLILGYYLFHSLTMILLITAIVVFHELGHFFAMKLFRYKDLGIFFIPLLGAYVSGSKREVSQKESAIILLAGPLPGIVVGVVMYLLWQQNPELNISGTLLDRVAFLTIFLNLINLLPIYPLDGGQLLNRVFLNEESWVSKIFVYLSVALLTWFALFRIGYPLGLPLLLFPAMMLLRLFGDSKITNIEKRIEEEGINVDCSYEDLSDENYWKIRKILIQEHASFKDLEIETGDQYENSAKEEKVMQMIQTFLHRHLIQDMPALGKVLVLVICVAAFASPWLLKMDMSIFRQFGF